jgi:hypothetical protein
MMLELNEVLIDGEPRTLTMMAHEGQLTCLTGGTPARRLRWLHAMLGFDPVVSGYISIDGEPLEPATYSLLRPLMAFAPAELPVQGEIVTYEPPTVQDVFALKANRELPISNGILTEEMKRTGMTGEQARLLAVAVLLDRPVLLVDSPSAASADYLHRQAAAGRSVVAATDDPVVMRVADGIVEL